MALEEGDADALKRNVLHLLLWHPQGVSFGDFSGAFYHLHGYHPHLALHGYRSLKDLVADMEDVAVLENDSQKSVIKLANGSHLPWMEEEGNGLDSSEGEVQSLIEEEQAGEEADVSTSNSVVTQNLVDEPTSQTPGLWIAALPIWDVLESHPLGLKVKKLKEALREKHEFDLEVLCCDLGYKDMISCLQDIPGLLLLNSNRVQNCVVQLQSGPPSPAPSLDTDFSTSNLSTSAQGKMRNKSGSSSPTPSLDMDFSAVSSNTIPQRLMAKKSDLDAAFVLILDALGGHPLGLDLAALKDSLVKKHGFDLETFSQDLGYKDVASCLLTMKGLRISWKNGGKNGMWLHSCVVQSLVCSPGLPPWLLSANPSLDKSPPSSGSNISLQELIETKPVSRSSTPSHSSASLAMKQYASKSETPNQGVLEKKSGSRNSISSQSSTSLTSLQWSASQSKTLNRNNLREMSDVLALLTSLLSMYKSGLKVKKVQKFLLTRDGVDLEKFSIAHGHMDSLAFLEHQMPELKFYYQENRLECVVQLESGSVNSALPLPIPLMKPVRTAEPAKSVTDSEDKFIPPLLDASIPLKQPARAPEPANYVPGFGIVAKPSFPVHDSSTNRSCIQRLPVPTTIPKFPSSQEPPDAFSGKAKSSSQPYSGISPQLPCPLGTPLPAEERPSLTNAHLQSRFNLTKPHPSKDMDELKQQVAQILATHPEGMSLFEFRAAYSAAYQQHLPLGYASSAKQRLLEMPDVVCLKGYGVQTLLLPVSTKEAPVESGQPIFSKMENAAVLPTSSLPSSGVMAEPVVVPPSSVPKAPVVPQPCPIYPLTSDHVREPSNKESFVFLEDQLPRSSKLGASSLDYGKARANLGHPSGLSKVERASVASGSSLCKAEPLVVPKSCLKTSPLPKAALAPVPQPRTSISLYSDCFNAPSSKESHPVLNSTLCRAPKTVASVQEHVITKAKPKGAPLIPSTPVVFPSHFQITGWGEKLTSTAFVSQPMHLDNSWVSGSTTSPSVLASSKPWPQAVVCSPVTFSPQIPELPPVYPVSFQPVCIKPSKIQSQETTLQSSHLAQAAPQLRPVQPISPIQVIDQRTHVCTSPGLDPFSQVQTPSRTLEHTSGTAPIVSAGRLPNPLPYRNPPSIYPSKSQTAYKSEYYQYTRPNDLSCNSVPAVDNSTAVTSSARAPAKSPAPIYWRQQSSVNSVITSPSTSSSSSQPASTTTSLKPSYADPQAFVYQETYVGVSSAVASSATQPLGSLSTLDVCTNASHQSSSSNSIDYNAPSRTKFLPAVSKEAGKLDSHHATLLGEQKPSLIEGPTTPGFSTHQFKPPPKSSDRCIIL